MGKIENRCRLSKFPINEKWLINEKILNLCGIDECPEENFCGNPFQYKLALNSSEYNSNFKLYYGEFNFNNIFSSLFTSLSLLSITGWSSINDIYWKSTNRVITAIFTVSYVLFISTILVNLLVGGLYDSFVEKQKEKMTSQLPQEESLTFINKWNLLLDEESPKLKRQHIKNTPSTLFNQFFVYKICYKIYEKFNAFKIIILLKIGVKNFRRILRDIYRNNLFKKITIILIIINALTLCLENSNFNDKYLRILFIIDIILLFLFYIEFFIGLLGYGYRTFLLSKLNIIDFLLIIIFSISLIISIKLSNNYISDDFKIFRTIRSFYLLRLIKVLLSVSYLKDLGVFMLELTLILKELFYFMLLIFIFIVCVSIFGKKLFAEENVISINEELERTNFFNFYNSLISNLLIFLNEEWHIIMFSHMKAYNYFYLLYFVFTLLFFAMFLNKIFLALLINGILTSKKLQNILVQNDITLNNVLKKLNSKFFSLLQNFSCLKKKLKLKKNSKIKINCEKKNLPIKNNTFFFTFTFYSKLKKLVLYCNSILNKKFINSSYMFIIIISLIIQSLYNPLIPKNDSINRFLLWIEIFTCLIYLFEIICNIFSMRKNNFLLILLFDILILIIYVIAISIDDHTIRLIIILKIIKFPSYSKSLNLAIKALYLSIVDVLKLTMFFFLIIILFALIGVKYFNGSYFYCFGIIEEERKFIHTKQDCFDYGYDWINKDFNFDNIINGFVLFYVVSYTEGWLPLMYDIRDSVGKDINPKINNNNLWSIFFIIFAIIAKFIVLNLLIGVLVEKYLRLKIKIEKLDSLTEFQKEWLYIKQRIYKIQPKKIYLPDSAFKKKLYEITKHNNYRSFIIFINSLHLIIFLLSHHREPDLLKTSIKWSMLIFNSIYVLELFLHFFIRKRSFISNIWNISSLIIIFCFFLDFFILSNESNSFKDLKNLIGLIQFLRVGLLMRHILILKRFFTTLRVVLLKSFPIIFLFFIIIFIFGLIGVKIFCFLKPQNYLNGNDIQFQNIFYSIITLLRIAIGESWFTFLADSSREIQPNFICYKINDYNDYIKYGLNGCGTKYAYLYFFAFNTCIVLVLNLMIGIILNISEKIKKNEESAINLYQLYDMIHLWSLYDPDGTGYISFKDFWKFASQISIVLGVNQKENMTLEKKIVFLKLLKLPIYENLNKNKVFCFYFRDVLLKLSQIVVIIKLNVPNLDLTIDQSNRKIIIKENKNFQITSYDSGVIGQLMSLMPQLRVWKRQRTSRDMFQKPLTSIHGVIKLYKMNNEIEEKKSIKI